MNGIRQVLQVAYKFCFFSDRVAAGRALDLPVYFGDAGSREVKINVS